MHVHPDAAFGDAGDDPVAVGFGGAGDAQQVQVVRRFAVGIGEGRADGPLLPGKGLLVKSGDPFALGEQLALVPADLRQAHGCADIGQVALQALVDDVVAPGAGLVLFKGALGLAVEGEGLEEAVFRCGVKRRRQFEADGAALARGHVLDRMKGKHRDVRQRTRRPALVGRSDGMRRIGQHQRPAEHLLPRRRRVERGVFQDFEQGVVIAGQSAHVHRNDGFGARGQRPGQLCGVQVEIVAHIHHHDRRADVEGAECRCAVRIGRDDHLVAGAYAEPPEGQHRARRPRIDAHSRRRAAEPPHFFFELQHLGPAGQPAGIRQAVQDLVNDGLVDEGEGEGDFQG